MTRTHTHSNKHTDRAGGWACTSHPGVLGSIPKREERGKTGRHPVFKYRVPHGSQLVNTGLGSSSLVAHVLHYPPLPPREQLCNRSYSNKHTQQLAHHGSSSFFSSHGWHYGIPQYDQLQSKFDRETGVTKTPTPHWHDESKTVPSTNHALLAL